MRILSTFVFTLAIVLDLVELSWQSEPPSVPQREKLPIRRRNLPSSGNQLNLPADLPVLQLSTQGDSPRGSRVQRRPGRPRKEISVNVHNEPLDLSPLEVNTQSDSPGTSRLQRRPSRPRKEASPSIQNQASDLSALALGSPSHPKSSRRRADTDDEIDHQKTNTRLVRTATLHEIYERPEHNSRLRLPSSSSSSDSSSADSSIGPSPPRDRRFFLHGQPIPEDRLGYVRLVPRINPNRRFEFRIFVIPANRGILMRFDHSNEYMSLDNSKLIVLSTADGDVFAYSEHPRVLRGLYRNNEYHPRIKINMISKRISNMDLTETRECPVDKYDRNNERDFIEETAEHDSMTIVYR